jgi:osmotically inducible protein OsmC
MKPIYEATATAHAGRNGRVSTDDGKVDLGLALPTEMGGSGDGTNPEQLFAAGYAACFHSALLFVAQGRKLNMSGSSVTGHVAIGENPSGPGFALAVRHDVRLPNLAQADAEALVAEADKVCPYSNAVRGNVEGRFAVSGQ